MALIHELNVSDVERNNAVSKVQSVFRTYHLPKHNKEHIETFFAEWKDIAARVKRGGEMLDKIVQPMTNESQEHLEKVMDLYTLLLKMLGLYELLFRKMFEGNPDRFYRAYGAVYKELS